MHVSALQLLFLLLQSALQNVMESLTTSKFVLGDPLVNVVEDDFGNAADEQNRVCNRHRSCSPKGAIVQSKCCGFCTCDFPSCTNYGSCCLNKYGSFTLGRDSVQYNRYECVKTQFLPPEDTDFITDMAVWLIIKCAPDYDDSTVIEQCKNPGQVLESVVPVTEPATRIHYRNKHCAYCNWVDKDSHLIYWNIQIDSNQHMRFPNDNLLSVINNTRGNVFFKLPEYIEAPTCDPRPEYYIGTCNETGLWREYKRETKIACESFMDPFNNTYKNYFCYLCNTATPNNPENWSCPPTSKTTGYKTPRFSAVLDLSAISPAQNHENLVCKGSQFKDLNKMTCRDVVCHNHGQLSDGTCRPNSKAFTATCFSIFVKLTPLPGEKPLNLAEIDFPVFVSMVKYNLKAENPSQGSGGSSSNKEGQSFRLLYKTADGGYLKYVVVYIQTILKSGQEIYTFLDNIMQQPIIDVTYSFELYTRYSVELATYNITGSEVNTKVFIPHQTIFTVDEIYSDRAVPDVNICPHTETVQLSNLYRCPYVILDTEEIPTKIIYDFLYIPGYMVNNEYPKILSKWDYEIHDEKIHICLNDYLDIYHLVPRANLHIVYSYNSRAVSNELFLHIFLYFVFVINLTTFPVF